jgi:predicted HAD superfamily phosphohydrolase
MKMTNKIESELQELVLIYEKRLPVNDVDSIKELVGVGEYAVAFENFCTQLYEYDVAVAQSDRSRLEIIGKEMRLEDSLWTDLEVED